MDKIFTTLKQLRSNHPCGIKRRDDYGYNKLLKTLGRNYGDHTPITLREVYTINGYEDTLWALRAVSDRWHGVLRHFFLDAADDVKHLMRDKRSVNAVNTARRVVDGEISPLILTQAWRNARDAAWETSKDFQVWGENKLTAMAISRGVAMDAVATCGQIRVLRTIEKDDVEPGRSALSGSADALAFAADNLLLKYDIREAQMARLFKYCETGERVITLGR